MDVSSRPLALRLKVSFCIRERGVLHVRWIRSWPLGRRVTQTPRPGIAEGARAHPNGIFASRLRTLGRLHARHWNSNTPVVREFGPPATTTGSVVKIYCSIPDTPLDTEPTMDVQRTGVHRQKLIRRMLLLSIAFTALAFGAWRVSRLEPAAPSVDRGTVHIDAVKRGPMTRDVRGLGTLIPEQIVWIPAAFESQISEVLARSGTMVRADTPLLLLSNPDMELAAADLEWQVKQAEANLTDLEVKLESQRLDQQAALAGVASTLKQATLTKERDDQLLTHGLKADLEAKISAAKWEELKEKYELDKRRMEISQKSADAQLGAQRVQIEKLKAAYRLKEVQVKQLTIRAGINGVLQELTLQPGQRVKPGDVLAKVAQPTKLMARLQIPETQAKDVLLNQPAAVDTRNGIVPGHVMRIDPNVINGTRTVDCALDGPLPPGAVPDLSVDGTIEIEKLTNVLYVGRPVFGQPNAVVGMFKIDGEGRTASRTTVKLGRISVSVVEVVDGLQEGDQVILSDMSAQDRTDRIRLE